MTAQKDFVKQEWLAFSDRVIPQGASNIRRDEMRKAFYAGSVSMLATVSRAFYTTDLQKGVLVNTNTVDRIGEELQEYITELTELVDKEATES